MESETSSKQKEAGQAALSEIVRIEKVAMCFDIELQPTPPTPWSHRFGEEAFRFLGRAYERRWETVEGVQVFTREGYRFGGEKESLAEKILSWLVSLSPSELQALALGEMNLGYVDGSFARDVRNFAAIDGLMVKVLLEGGNEVSVKAGIDARFEYVDKETGTTKTVSCLFKRGFTLSLH